MDHNLSSRVQEGQKDRIADTPNALKTPSTRVLGKVGVKGSKLDQARLVRLDLQQLAVGGVVRAHVLEHRRLRRLHRFVGDLRSGLKLRQAASGGRLAFMQRQR
jgi:hypothetical protein